MSNEKKAIYWQKHIAAWQQSGQTQRSYCLQQNLKPPTFSYWRKRLDVKRTTKKLIPIAISRHVESTIVISTQGLRMEVPLAALEQVLSLVKRHLHEPL